MAQTSARSYRGLFGGASSGAERDPVTLSVAVTEAYDQNVLGDALSGPSVFQEGGAFTQLTADLAYRGGGRKVQFASTAGTNFRYYQQQDQLVGIGHHAGAGVSISLSPGTSLSLNQTVSYAPSYLYRLFTSVAAPELGQVNVATDYAVSDSPSYNYGTNVTMTNRLGPHSELSLQASGQYTDYLHNASTSATGGIGLPDLLSYQVGGTFSQGLSRHVNLNLGYTFRRAQYFGSITPNEHDINVGVTYDRPLSATRTTHLTFGVGSSMLQVAAPGDPLAILRPYYRFVGDLGLTHQFGRTWQADGGYHRGVGFVEGILTPVLTDAVVAGVSGMLNRRVNISLNAARTVGEPTIGISTHGFTTSTASARTQMALNRTVATYVEYIYYFYDFTNSVVLVGAPPRMSRNSVRAGMTLWVPVRKK